MRQAILLLAMAAAGTLCQAQPRPADRFAADVRKAEQLLRQGRPQSALDIYEALLRRARQTGDIPRQLQALHAVGQATLELQGEARRHHITRLRNELPNTRGAHRALLHGMLGKAYWDYLQEHRWELRDRRNTGGRNPDIDTWSARDFHDAIATHLRQSLAEPATLQAIPTRDWQPIVAKGALPALRPTLYDLVAQAALDYFSRADDETPSFANAFVIDDSTAFAPAERFATHRFADADSLSHKARALAILQALLTLHLRDADPAALLEADIQRLRFVHEASVSPDKEDRYLRALSDIRRRHSAHPASAQAAYLHLALERSRLDRQDPALHRRPDSRTLIDIAGGCRRLMALHPGSEGALNAERLLQQLLKRTLSLTAEKVNLPGRPFRLRTAFRNLPEMHYRVIALTNEGYDTLLRRSGDDFWTAVRQLTHVRAVRQPLPDPGDLRPHAAEIRIDPLPVGQYLILASPEAGFPLRGQPLSALVLHVSRIAWASRGQDLFVLDRETGRPLHDANVRAWRARYDYDGRMTHLEAPVSLRTDLDGHVRLPDASSSDYRPRRLDVAWQDDRLRLDENEPLIFSDDRAWTGDRDEYETRYRRLYLFTDRKLYRPGQTVQFKGLFVTRDFDTRRPKVVADHATVVYLRDANGDTRDSLSLTTGAYGSFSGSFRLPARGLTGTYTLAEDHGQAEVQVEEYRRPTFDVAWKEAEGAFRLSDTVTVRGEARSFTGAAANGAKVSYRVTRVTRYPYPWYGRYFGWEPPADRTVEIARGETLSGVDGGFRIAFPALPDRSVDPDRLPVFEYEVGADVTDIGGETRSATTTVRLGYHSIQLSLLVPEAETHPNDRDMAVDVGAANLSGGPRPTATTLTLRPLQGPRRFLRERYWPMTDTTVLPEADYIRDFPNDPYRDEGNRETWSSGAPVISRTDTPRHGGQPVTLPTRGLPHGWYRLELKATEADGRVVATRKDILLRDAVSGLSDPYGYFSQHLSTPVAQPGETAVLGLSTALDDLWVIQLLDGYAGAEVPATHRPRGGRPTHSAAPPNPGHPYRFVGLSRGTTALDLPIGEEDRGGFGIGHVFVRHNRFHSHGTTLAVPWRNRELDLRLTTWRDKTEPGSTEQWSLTLRGHQGERVAAEVLMSMYDASLDAILPFAWEKPEQFDSYPYRYDRYMPKDWHFRHSFATRPSSDRSYPDKAVTSPDRTPDALVWSRQGEAGLSRHKSIPVRISGRAPGVVMAMDANAYRPSPRPPSAPPVLAETKAALNEVVVVAKGARQPATAPRPVAVQFRKDFRETAFFLPDLRTDSSGNLTFRFTMPEALTQWKWQVLAHTRELASALATQTVVTRKELMVQPNAPRFLREGDRLTLPVRITNLADSERTGQARLELYDPATGQPVDGYFHNVFPEQFFTAPAGQSVAVTFTLTVPADFSRPVAYRILARTDRHADGEERTLPVLSNRQLVTESMPLRVQGLGTRDLRFDRLLQSGASPTLTQHRLTLEYATNPVWYAVKSLPYLTAYPHECVEQSLNRFYANAVAAQAAAASPRIREWVLSLGRDSAAARRELASNVGRNASLRDILLEETPWVLEARDEERQRRSLAVLFDTLRIAAELERAFSRVRSAQHPDGGFTWFPGGPSDRYMSQYVLAQLGRMRSTGAVPPQLAGEVDEVFSRGLNYIAGRLEADDREATRQARRPGQPSPLQVQALYALSCDAGHEPPASSRPAIRQYRRLLASRWQGLPLQTQAMAALLLHRAGEGAPAKAILRSLRERAVHDTVLGMYWNSGNRPWQWHDAPVETQSLLIEAFLEVDGDTAAADRMRLWLLSKKQTERWESTRATADACRALLTGGSDWLAADRSATITLGTTTPTSFRTPDGGAELLATVEGDKVRPDMGHVRVSVTGRPAQANTGVSWGAAHWQYFEHLDRITAAGGPLSVQKTLYRERLTDKGPLLEEVPEEGLRVGDRIVVRLTVRSDRDMEYIHLKDMRPSGTEPVDVLSEYRWQGRLGYYMSTRDASTNLFLPILPKGTHVFEYALWVSHAGQFPAGIATVECMYAPAFRGQSDSPMLRVSERTGDNPAR
jgi:hypothetical protein